MLLQDTYTEIGTDERRRDRSAPITQPATDMVPLTRATGRALEHELAILREEKVRAIPARLRVAREFGDTANNDEHFAIREDEVILAARIARLEDILARATVVEGADPGDSVGIGSEVVAVDLDTGERLEYVIGSAYGALPRGTVSPLSPVGRALVGRRRGERVSVELPSGRRRKLGVREIRASAGA
jgi:transcription elongation factor GreA